MIASDHPKFKDEERHLQKAIIGLEKIRDEMQSKELVGQV